MTLSIFRLVIIAWVGVAAVAFIVLLRVRAPYGRHTQSGWGPTIDHRLGWFLMELPALLVFAWFVLSGSNPMSIATWIFFAAWQIHYVHRTLVFPFRMAPGSKRMPLAIVGSAIFFNSVNGFLNGYFLGSLGPTYELAWISDWRFVVGATLFVVGLVINLQSDSILLRLRRSGRYEIPRGALFNLVSCPNYLGEIVEWIGFALMTWSPAAAAFALWTAANLIPRALSNHRWYHERFSEYPSGRRALIPYLV